MDITGTFRKESREFEGGELGWIIGGIKDRGFGWGMIRGGGEQCFEGLEGRMGMNRVRVLFHRRGKRGMKE